MDEKQPVEALKGVSFHLKKGGFLSITGSSGSGKTTLMNIVGCLTHQDSGKFLLDGIDISSLSPNRVSELRNRSIGFVFQGFNLISSMTALENVMLPLALRGMDMASRRKAAVQALEAVGLGDRMHHRPGRLSGGQQQRVAVARVIACRTPLILADEPTGSLDGHAASEVMDILARLNKEGVSILLITHDSGIASMATSRAEMR
ncbi:MAG: ABC transporter ATP-binding protein, partial [Clostridia bacterium]|nr:ABC transporter ATP-binding protein [Clostridia bacterium]